MLAAPQTLLTGADAAENGDPGAAAAPSAPRAFALTEGPHDRQITLTWAPPEWDGGSPITGYVVWRWAGNGGDYRAWLGNVTSFTDNVEERVSGYRYRVAARNADGIGTYTQELTAIAGEPGRQRNLLEFDGTETTLVHENPQPHSQIRVQHDRAIVDSDDRDPGDASLAHVLPAQWTSADTSFTVVAEYTIGCVSATHYDARFYPLVLRPAGDRDAEGPGTVFFHARSDCFKARPLDPAVVTITFGYVDASGIRRIHGSHTYTDSSSFMATVVEYDAVSGVLTLRLRSPTYRTVASASYTVGTNPGDGFAFERLGVAADGTGAASESPPVGGATWFLHHSWKHYGAPGSPAAPAEVSATRGPGLREVTVAWTAVENGAPEGYVVYRSSWDSPLRPIATVSGTTFVDQNLKDGWTYAYRITAVNDVGESLPGAPASATTFGKPAAPESLRATAGPGPNQVTLSWDPPTSDGGRPIQTYRLYRTHTIGAYPQLVAVLADDARGYLDTNLANGTTYSYRITATNDVGESWHAAASARTFAVPGAPWNPSVSPRASTGSVAVSWSEPVDTGGTPVVSYRVYRRDVFGSERLVAETPHDHWFDRAPSGVHYYYVAAVNAVGEGARAYAGYTTAVSSDAVLRPGVVQAAGAARHTTASCTFTGQFSVTVDTGDGAAVIAGSSWCWFADFAFPPGSCTGTVATDIACDRRTSTGFTSLRIDVDGRLEYEHRSDTSEQRVTGKLRRV